MHAENLLLEFMAKVNDALKSDEPESVKLKIIYQAKRWAEDEYAKARVHDEAILGAMLAKQSQ